MIDHLWRLPPVVLFGKLITGRLSIPFFTIQYSISLFRQARIKRIDAEIDVAAKAKVVEAKAKATETTTGQGQGCC